MRNAHVDHIFFALLLHSFLEIKDSYNKFYLTYTCLLS